MQNYCQNNKKYVLEPWQQDHWGVSGEEESNDAKESDDNDDITKQCGSQFNDIQQQWCTIVNNAKPLAKQQ